MIQNTTVESPTLAQGVNIPFDTVLVYRLQHHIGKPIHDAAFWNVVGRVGRPIGGDPTGCAGLRSPQVVFLNNGSPTATYEDKSDVGIGRRLVSRQKQYRVASPFLQFLKRLRIEWEQSTGQSIVELVTTLAERSDLHWVADPKTRKDLSTFLRQLDEHLIALAEESGEETDDWLQARSGDVVDLLVQATAIEADDLNFIKAAVLARASFIVKHIPKGQRHQDYLLGLPLIDCEAIRANQNRLLVWYQGCADIFACRFQTGVQNLVQILDFVWGLSICPRKWGSNQIKPLPLLGYTMPFLWEEWIQGQNTQVVASILSQMKPGADFDEYREDMLEGALAWGLSAVCKFSGEVAQEKGLFLTRDLEFLPSLVKYGVPGKLPCYLVRLKIPREVAAKIAEFYADKFKAKGFLPINIVQSEFMHAEQSVISLTEEDIEFLDLSDAVVERIREIKARISP